MNQAQTFIANSGRFFGRAGDGGQTFRLVNLLWMDRISRVSDFRTMGCQSAMDL
jgi:hypothetical protein